MTTFAKQFSEANYLSHTVHDGTSSPQAPSQVWRPPLAGFYKINVDGALKIGDSIRGVGVVVRNERGEFMGACVKSIQASYGARQTKLMAAIEGMRFSIDMGLNYVILEMDAQVCIKGILSTEECSGTDGLLFEEAKNLLSKFRGVLCQWTPRSGNKAAHTLAHFAISCNDFVSWIEDAPMWLLPVLDADVLPQ
ncbi:uncharacterized protein LOC110765903 [Prunus avium]|uniref:Uncharacterized protein LOC110765903 n=1 Tax=Prunus avium TaxID=42229 RepID=A0A6P5TBX9_PRUAV|nr:uncharacterized protein LOC110765903 [Prunus avium]